MSIERIYRCDWRECDGHVLTASARPSGTGFITAEEHVDGAERAAVRWLGRYTAEDRQLRLAEARELVDMLVAVGRHDQVAQLRLARFLRARGYEVEADRLSA